LKIAHSGDAVSAADLYRKDVTNGSGEGRIGTVPLFMDHHKGVEGLTAEAVADAHRKDMEIQDQYGVKYHRYWFNEETGEVWCLAEAPNKEAAEAVHREAHGLMADEIAEVKEGS
jgi:hypothetical protein